MLDMMSCSSDGATKIAVRVENFMMAMPDGVKLYTSIVTPAGATRTPIVFLRSPYCTKDSSLQALCDGHNEWLRAGYSVVHQHCRGTGLSEGEFIPYINERDDGLATLRQLHDLPFYADEVYLYGGSYSASVHFAYLGCLPPEVKGAVLCVQDANRYNIHYRNSCYKCGLHGGWAVSQYKKNSGMRKNYTIDTFRMLPLNNFSQTVFGEPMADLDNSFANPLPTAPFWNTTEAGGDFLRGVRHFNIPVLFISSWYDIYTEGIFDMWKMLTSSQRAMCALVVTPYDHGFSAPQPGKVAFPNGTLNEVWPHFSINWLDSIRYGSRPDFVQLGKITWYAIGRGEWITGDSVEGNNKHLFYLGDHTLLDHPETASEIEYVYNPFNPAAFEGGCCTTFGGMQVQHEPNSRYDIISFLSAPLEKPLWVNGKMKARLRVKSDCEDTCFYLRTSLFHNDIAYCLRDDITTLSLQHGQYQPGKVVELSFSFCEHSFMAEAGDQIRLDISSSCWPHYIPHTNRPGLQAAQIGASVAHNTIICEGSTLEISVR